MLWTDLTVEDANECLDTLWYGQVSQQDFSATAIQESNTKGVSSYSALVDRVAEYYTISVADLKSDSRKKEIVIARQLLMMLAKHHFKWTFEKIGDFFGGKNHASVIYAVNTIEKKLKIDKNIKHDYNVFVDWLE